MRLTQTLARANGAGLSLSPGKSRFKAYRLYPAGIGLTPKQTFPTTVGGLVGLNQSSERTAMTIYAYLIQPGAGFRIQRPHWK